MGLNAQTAVPVFTAGQILTAQQQKEINTGIPVFATTVTRDAAFGGTGEKTLAEGQFAYIEATDTTQYYDGAAWQTVGATPGLRVVKAETAFSAVAAVTADSVFTSSYTNYRIIFQSATAAGAPVMNFNLRVGGVNATTNYTWQSLSVASTTVTGQQQTATTSWQLGLTTTTNGWWIMDILNPQLAVATHATTNMMQGNLSTTWQYWSTNTNATSYDGFSFAPATSTLTGSYTVYGYGKSL
jgi:hypothetical protein